MVSATSFFTPAPDVRPALNVGCLFDIMTGTYCYGKHGEAILNGGLSYATGVAGRGNTFKSTLSHFFMLSVMNRYFVTDGLAYDTENSLTAQRVDGLSQEFDRICNDNVVNSGRLIITDAGTYGNVYWDQLKKYGKEKRASKECLLTTPFMDRNGKNITIVKPTVVEIDSLSQMPIEAVVTIHDKNQIGESGMNVEAMKGAAAKSQMVKQLPTVTAIGELRIIMTAHLGDSIKIDPYAPSKKKLAVLKGEQTFKSVPEGFSFLTNNLYLTSDAKPCWNSDKTPMWPRDKNDRAPGDMDLQMITVNNARAKSGPTGMPIEIIVSQSEGVKVGLSQYNHIKNHNYYGIGGNKQTFCLDLYPDVNLQRTTIRGLLEEDEKLARAMEITSELCQIQYMWKNMGKLICPAAELYEDLKAKGYDWDVLLNTRGYWIFEGEEHDLPFLSTMDLLNMRAGTYVPYWYKDVTGVEIKPQTAA